MNLYPQRSTNPNGMTSKFNPDIHKTNLHWIEKIIKKQKNPTIWASWGTLIEQRSYLKECLKDILNLSMQYDCKWVSIGKISKHGHPHHPLYLLRNEKIKPFDVKEYSSLI